VTASPEQFDAPQGPRRRVDEVTGVAYRVIAQARLEGGRDATLRVVRGTVATRAVLLVDKPGAVFGADDVEATPRALLALRAWQSAAPGGSPSSDARTGPRLDATTVISASIALTGVMVAVWWVASGRRRSRERGTDRTGPDADRN